MVEVITDVCLFVLESLVLVDQHVFIVGGVVHGVVSDVVVVDIALVFCCCSCCSCSALTLSVSSSLLLQVFPPFPPLLHYHHHPKNTHAHTSPSILLFLPLLPFLFSLLQSPPFHHFFFFLLLALPSPFSVQSQDWLTWFNAELSPKGY